MDYKEAREKFVSGHTGTDISEVILLMAIPFISLFVRELLASLMPCDCLPSTDTPSLIKNSRIFLLDFITLVIPSVLSCTIFSTHVASCVVTLACIGVGLYVFAHMAHSVRHRKRTRYSDIMQKDVDDRRLFISACRASMLITTAVYILAVDFPVFPRRFAKAEMYGTGLMDAGVGLFIIANSVLSPEARNAESEDATQRGNLKKSTISSMPLVTLGLARVIVIYLTDYPTHVSEYGVHWNFFFTLAVVKVISSILYLIVLPRYSVIVSFVIMIGYQQLLLNKSFQTFMMHGDRSGGLFSANREGIVSCIGFVALYMTGVQLGRFFFIYKRKSLFDLLLSFPQMCGLAMSCNLLLSILNVSVESVSRRMANLSYMVWILSLALFILAGFLFVEILLLFAKGAEWFYESDEEEDTSLAFPEPPLMAAVNKNAFLFFLLSNALTGFVNLSIKTIHCPDGSAVIIILVYSLILCLITQLFNSLGINTKFW